MLTPHEKGCTVASPCTECRHEKLPPEFEKAIHKAEEYVTQVLRDALTERTPLLPRRDEPYDCDCRTWHEETCPNHVHGKEGCTRRDPNDVVLTWQQWEMLLAFAQCGADPGPEEQTLNSIVARISDRRYCRQAPLTRDQLEAIRKDAQNQLDRMRHYDQLNGPILDFQESHAANAWKKQNPGLAALLND